MSLVFLYDIHALLGVFKVFPDMASTSSMGVMAIVIILVISNSVWVWNIPNEVSDVDLFGIVFDVKPNIQNLLFLLLSVIEGYEEWTCQLIYETAIQL